MGFLKSLFGGVYSSNRVITLVFLPLCYALLISPFVLVFTRLYNISIFGFIPERYTTADIVPTFFVLLVTTSLATRSLTGFAKNDRKGKVQLYPYWLPFVRHWGNLVFGGEGWLKGVQDSTFESIIAYDSAGSKHNVIVSGPLLDQLTDHTDALEEAELGKWITLRNAFGLSPYAKDKYLELRPEISKTIEAELFKGKQVSHIISRALNILSQSLPDLITFNSSIVDQMQWERVSVFELTDGTDEVEADLFALINEFFCNAILPPITGDGLPETYQLLISDLASFNQSFYALAMGFPRLFPVPGLPGASLARRRLSQHLITFFNDLSDPPVKRVVQDDESMSGEEDTDAEIPTPLTALNELFEQHEVPLEARAAITIEVLHRVVSQTIPLAFWTILHIYSSSSKSNLDDTEISPVVRIRGETKDWAAAYQPPSIHPRFPSPPAIDFLSPTQALSDISFPYLRSCITEAKRLYSSSFTALKVTKPITLKETVFSPPGAEEKWELDVGSYIDVGLSRTLINSSSADYLLPKDFKPDRFLDTPPVTKPSSDVADDLTTALVLSLVAGVVQLWEIAPAPKKGIVDLWHEVHENMPGAEETKEEKDKKEEEKKKTRKVGTWATPKGIDGAYFKVPKGELRVRIRRREGLAGPKTVKARR
ncbi:hypothetical protein K504DRAFT_469535 [Pleomassaria siparia CBS 279.74]|uniref:Cytochrome P450 n=1 Tax=Pleomassaria siparia CBS 279.74 TaxID=1314801 RepID=A0A6G1KSB4_9PLEO|nr:hypothetical protein K504DRAFT_469535 [Pleomassaria siparia CBS 279.74]